MEFGEERLRRYRAETAKIRREAAAAEDELIRQQRLAIATLYERLADDIEILGWY
jgi:hypothetical protein